MIRFLKRFACVLLATAMIVALTACKEQDNVPVSDANETISIYSSFYPLYAITEMIVKDVEGVQSMCLVQPQDGCLRNYQLSDWDLALLMRSADAVIAGGRGLESFESTLFALSDYGPAVTAVLYNMDLKRSDAQGIPEGEASHWQDENPHVYMSVDGAIAIAERISAAMQEMDPKYSKTYRDNFISAEARLNQLKEEMHGVAGGLFGVKTAVLNEALLYFAGDFGLDMVLCCHRESGDGIDKADALIESIRESGAELILIEKQAPYALVTALEDAGYAVAKIDILSTHTAQEGCEGYFEAQIANANSLKAAAGTLEG